MSDVITVLTLIVAPDLSVLLTGPRIVCKLIKLITFTKQNKQTSLDGSVASLR